MDVRESLNKRPALMVGILAIVIAIALGTIWAHFFGGRSGHPKMPGKAFFSDDDGQSFFIDDQSKIPPFDHGGKPACRAQVYRCGNGEPFVWILERYDMAELERKQQWVPPGTTRHLVEVADALQVKRPGDKSWINGTDTGALAAAHLLTPSCPDSKDGPRIVFPGEQ